MSLNLNGNVTGIYLGSAKADAVYLGNVKVFEDTPIRYETILGEQYPVVTIGGVTITAANLVYIDNNMYLNPATSESDSRKCVWNYGGHSNPDNSLYYGWKALYYVVHDLIVSGWHLPTANDWNEIVKALNNGSIPSTTEEADSVKRKLFLSEGWINPGNNSSGLSLGCYGCGSASGRAMPMSWSKYNSSGYGFSVFNTSYTLTNGNTDCIEFSDIGQSSTVFSVISTPYGNYSQFAYPIRLVKDA